MLGYYGFLGGLKASVLQTAACFCFSTTVTVFEQLTARSQCIRQVYSMLFLVCRAFFEEGFIILSTVLPFASTSSALFVPGLPEDKGEISFYSLQLLLLNLIH